MRERARKSNRKECQVGKGDPGGDPHQKEKGDQGESQDQDGTSEARDCESGDARKYACPGLPGLRHQRRQEIVTVLCEYRDDGKRYHYELVYDRNGWAATWKDAHRRVGKNGNTIFYAVKLPEGSLLKVVEGVRGRKAMTRIYLVTRESLVEMLYDYRFDVLFTAGGKGLTIPRAFILKSGQILVDGSPEN